MTQAANYAGNTNLDDDFRGSWWLYVGNSINDGINKGVDTNRTRPGIDIQQYTAAELRSPSFYVHFAQDEIQRLQAFRVVTKVKRFWPEFVEYSF